ncbi:ArnT family glycosyltransferase [Rathayibacter iranicus]|uniref:Glycosyltransferase RgtA/B/C/D-like domain-containing protein n=2 Tax=Rathayibacter iranicus TaxID=59737 RepID=A0AAD1ENE1_9MICO|nr:hypothetical protein [Rathayibacter iranicus]AZZ56625.1 hypothetical protein C7V51_12635 [Rathayibacter iranicus]MWV32432.1 hypothetical protein [Rathayibacter iranicus NCPPB 2253 = VKM Ac-1602]PPI43271.1 hypothetical protein C5E09_11560 [Rathayibacter iranicus]PPI58482.1 hypothetical protein C5E08_12470 [Rathayibacter iranicus]PPI69427.1 hypothetical protein C5E01_11520 [Rathayibacter iranicus]
MTATLTARRRIPTSARAPWWREAWERLGRPVTGRQVPGTVVVLVVALLVGFVACLVTTSSGINLAYADTQSHLAISRRIIDSKAPGFTQLGTVWLPIPSLVLIPFVQSLWLWHTGWAAGLLGMICLAGTACGVYRISARVGHLRAGRITAVLLVLANPGVLYSFSTAMTEPVLIVTMVACFSGLAHWVTSRRSLSAGEMMVFSGLPAAAATLSRYEGWVLVFGGTVVVLIVAWRRKRSFFYAVKMACAFGILPLVAILWWLVYNFAVYSNPLEFMNGQYSAANLQKSVADAGLLAYQGNAGLTLWTYNWAVLETSGLVTVALGLAGALVLAWRRGISDDALVIWLMIVSYAFSLLSLYLGQTHMNNDHTFPTNWWNNRYALSVLPFLAVLAAVLVDALRRLPRVGVGALGLVLVLLGAQTAWWAQDLDRNAVIAEASGYVQLKEASGATAAARFLGEHYDGGGVLMDESAAGNALLPEIGIPLAEFYNRSTGELFDEALAHPATHAKWVFVTTADAPELSETGVADLVYDSLTRDSTFDTRYRPVFSRGNYVVYERLGG